MSGALAAPLWQRHLTACDLASRYQGRGTTNTLVSADVGCAEAEALPWVSPVDICVTKDEVHRDVNVSTGDKTDTVVHVVLLRLPRAPTRFTFHITKLITYTPHQSGGARLYGGYLDAVVDGDSTTHAAHVACATRYLKDQADLDLSALSANQWINVATFTHRHRDATGGPARKVYLVPKTWECSGEDLVVKAVRFTNTQVVEKKVMKNVEEEVEEVVDVERVLPGQEGMTEEELEKEIVQEVVKKMVTKRVEVVEQAESKTTQPFGVPAEYSISALMRSSAVGTELGYVVDFLRDWLLRAAAERIAGALEATNTRVVNAASRKRKRKDIVDEYGARKKRREHDRNVAVTEAIEALEAMWAVEDEGRTDEEIQDGAVEREAQRQHAVESAEATYVNEAAEDEERYHEALGGEVVDEESSDGVDTALLTAFSLYDANASDGRSIALGGALSETVKVSTLQKLLLSGVRQDPPLSLRAARALLPKSGDMMRYRSLTDKW